MCFFMIGGFNLFFFIYLGVLFFNYKIAIIFKKLVRYFLRKRLSTLLFTLKSSKTLNKKYITHHSTNKDSILK